MLGYDRAHLQTKTIAEITDPDDWAHEKKLLQKVVNGKQESYSIKKRCICRSGLPLWVNETVSAVRDDSGSYLYSIALFQVNERKHTEELFQLMLESSSDAMVIADGRGEIVLVNSSTEKFFGYRRSELLGKTMDFLLPSFLHARPGLTFGKLQMELMKGKWNSLVRRKDGTFFPAEIGVSAIEMGQGTWTLNLIEELSEHEQREERFLDVGIAS
jgi:protein-histidine pros-kinase